MSQHHFCKNSWYNEEARLYIKWRRFVDHGTFNALKIFTNEGISLSFLKSSIMQTDNYYVLVLAQIWSTQWGLNQLTVIYYIPDHHLTSLGLYNLESIGKSDEYVICTWYKVTTNRDFSIEVLAG